MSSLRRFVVCRPILAPKKKRFLGHIERARDGLPVLQCPTALTGEKPRQHRRRDPHLLCHPSESEPFGAKQIADVGLIIVHSLLLSSVDRIIIHPTGNSVNTF